VTVSDDIVPIDALFYADAGPHVLSTPAAAAAAPEASPFPAASAGLVSRSPTPRGTSLQDLLQSGIAGLTPLDTEPFSQPAEIEYDAVPIDDLLYHGRAAIDRAVELRREINTRGGAPTPQEIEELFALLDLAVAD
jgi:hypothetical protein